MTDVSGAPPADDHEPPHSPELADVYREVCAQIRATDEISLKLLAAVPLVTGVGIALVASAGDLSDVVRAFVSLLAAVIVFAIYCWERKNTATCLHLNSWALILERDSFRVPMPTRDKRDPSIPSTYPHGPVEAPPTLRRVWGKRHSENLLYPAAILSWLALGVYSLFG
jgi:hypothetical protein